ncbi:alpha/beta hydrolase [Riemerella anatipestifer]|uniref:alpha/beta hydrolase n=1 Tax=Riemerella anatipestifer TaxID=34085 RepID=UPI0030BC295B
MKKIYTVIVFTLFSVLTFGQNLESLIYGEKMIVNSKYLKEKTEVWIKVPKDFEKLKNNCSLVVLLDGDQYFGIATNVQYLYQWESKMPATIVVALPSTIESRWKYYTPTNSKNFTEKREDDKLFQSTGHFSELADFIENELIKYLEKKFKVSFKSKTIFGHSLGGLAVMSFYKIRPNVFDNYICASPSLMWEKFMFNNYYANIFPTNSVESRKIFLSSGNPDLNGYKNNVEDLVESLTTKIKNSEKIVKYIHYETEDHGSSGIRSLIDGLEFIYKNE